MPIQIQLARTVLAVDAGSRGVSVLLALSDRDSSLWPRAVLSRENLIDGLYAFLNNAGMPDIGQVVLCGMGCHDIKEESAQERASRMERWREELRQSGGDPLACIHDDMEGWEVQVLLEELKQEFGNVLAMDSGIAAIFAALSIDALRDRSWNEGVTIVYAGHSHTQAFMVFREKILGLYEQHAGLDKEQLLNDLKEVRLNWLPDEQVRAAGGHGCICGDFPPEAEGFRPTWILGPRRFDLEGCGRMASPCGLDAFERCYGMVYGLTRRETA